MPLQPHDPDLGFSFAWLIAGFAGGIVSLSFIRALTNTQAAMSVFTGAVTANYATPVVMQYISNTREFSNLSAFVIGLCAMNLIPGILYVAEQFRKDPFSFISRFRGDKK